MRHRIESPFGVTACPRCTRNGGRSGTTWRILVEMAAGSQQTTMRMNKRRVWIIAILALLAVIVVLAGIKAAQIATMIKAGKSFAPQPEAVTSAKVESVEWQRGRAAGGAPAAGRGGPPLSGG